MNAPPTTAALTLSLTGPFERQGTEAAEGVRLWAELAGIRLTLVDDRGSKTAVARAYAAWLDSMDLLIGPTPADWSGRWPPWSVTPGGCYGITADRPTTWHSRE